MSDREIYTAKGFGPPNKKKVKKRRKKKKTPTEDKKKIVRIKKGWPKSFYPEGTDLKEMADNLREEFRRKMFIKDWEKRNTMSSDEFFAKMKRNDYRD